MDILYISIISEIYIFRFIIAIYVEEIRCI